MNFGSIYSSTYWGNGVTVNTISWGVVYVNLV